MKTSKSLRTCSISIAVAFFASIILCGLIDKIAFGDQSQLLAECQIPIDEGTLRLYVTHGSSMTTSDSWTVTYQKSRMMKSTIFSAYSSPGIKNIECGQDEVVFTFYPNEPVTIPVSWIKDELIFKPVRFYKSELRNTEYLDEVSTWKGVYP